MRSSRAFIRSSRSRIARSRATSHSLRSRSSRPVTLRLKLRNHSDCIAESLDHRVLRSKKFLKVIDPFPNRHGALQSPITTRRKHPASALRDRRQSLHLTLQNRRNLLENVAGRTVAEYWKY